MDYANAKTRKLNLNTNKADMVSASEGSENLAIDFPQRFGFVAIRHADLFNMMRELPGNAFKLYLYFYTQKEGTSWSVHRDRIKKDTGLSEQEYRTAMAKLVELGIVDFEAATFNGIKPLTKEEIFKEIDDEAGEHYIADVDDDLKEDLDRHSALQTASDNTDEWTAKAKDMDCDFDDETFNTKKAALERRAEILAALTNW